MSCRAEIFAASRDNVLAVPIQAIRVEEDMTRNETRRYAFVDRDGKREARRGRGRALRRHVSGDHERASRRATAVIIGPDRVLRALKDGDGVTIKKDGR